MSYSYSPSSLSPVPKGANQVSSLLLMDVASAHQGDSLSLPTQTLALLAQPGVFPMYVVLHLRRTAQGAKLGASLQRDQQNV